MPRVAVPAGDAVGAVEVAEPRQQRREHEIVAITPTNIARQRRAERGVAPWICEPIHSHASGVPAHSTRLPITMISTTSTAPAPVLSTSRIDALRVAETDQISGPRRHPAPTTAPGLTDSRRRA